MYAWREHTGELELELAAPTVAGVFTEGLRALGELLEPEPVRRGTSRPRDVALTAPDPATLLAAWLDELAFLAESEGFVATAVERFELGPRDAALRATVAGHHGRPRQLVKAVTWHELSLEPGPEGWRGHVVLDV